MNPAKENPAQIFPFSPVFPFLRRVWEERRDQNAKMDHALPMIAQSLRGTGFSAVLPSICRSLRSRRPRPRRTSPSSPAARRSPPRADTRPAGENRAADPDTGKAPPGRAAINRPWQGSQRFPLRSHTGTPARRTPNPLRSGVSFGVSSKHLSRLGNPAVRHGDAEHLAPTPPAPPLPARKTPELLPPWSTALSSPARRIRAAKCPSPPSMGKIRRA